MAETWNGGEIAIIGMAGRFPGADSVDALWEHLRAGREAITALDASALRAAGESDANFARAEYVRAAAVLEGVDRFDAAFFRIGPRDAALMDPQHRHFLEVAWSALEHAGYDPARVPGPVGVFGGCGMNAYLAFNLLTNPALVDELGLFYVRHAGNDKDFLTTRVSYALDLKGPSVAIQTGSSTSLAAVHVACQSLSAHECDLALAGGVTIDLPHGRGYLHRAGGLLSSDGHCRPFDNRADGTVFGSGAAIVVLRRLEDALRDGDTIHAVILGSAVSRDTPATAGEPAGPSAAALEALSAAGVDPDTIEYVEAHASGIRLGDEAEVHALEAAYAPTTGRRQFCALGSVKGAIGHLDTAAGAASLITAVQALRHHEIPPTLHVHASSTLMDLARGPFHVNATLRHWPAVGAPRRAGVSALGTGGTNAHVVLQEAPAPSPPAPSRPWTLLTWSARTGEAVDRATDALASHLDGVDDAGLADVAFTLALGRRAFEERRAVVVSSADDARMVLRQGSSARVGASRADTRAPGVAFMFPGGGTQYPGMARGLFEHEPVFREAFGRCLDEVAALGVDGFAEAVFPAPDALDAAASELKNRAALALPAIFSVGYAMAQTLQAWGIHPSALIGHSLGEYVAACLAGVWSLPDALSIVVTRGRLFDALPPGAMLSVPASRSVIEPYLDDALSVAVMNSHTNTVVSGADAAIEVLEGRLSGEGLEHRRLAIRVAAHSRELDPILDEFRRALRAVTLKAPTLPYVSNVTGTWATPADAIDPEYWVRHLRSTVRFADGLTTLLAEPRALVELGPGSQLASLVRQHPGHASAGTILTTLRHAKEDDSDERTLLDAVGRLWTIGVPVDWDRMYAGEQRRRMPLPTYPFARDRHWIAPGRGMEGPADDSATALVRPNDVAQWLGRPQWVRRTASLAASSAPALWLVFTGALPIGAAVADALTAAGHHVHRVRPGSGYADSDGEYTVRPGGADDYEALLTSLPAGGASSLGVVHAWALDPPSGDTPAERFDAAQTLGFSAALVLLQALQHASLAETARVWFLGAGFESVAEQPVERPDAATLRGLALVAPAEFLGLRAGTIDIGSSDAEAGVVGAIVAELTAGGPAPRAAFRTGERLEHEIAMAPAAGTSAADGSAAPTPLRAGGVYLITGGLGGVGLAHARFLARDYGARVALVSRRGQADRDGAAAAALESLGGEVLVLHADVTDAEAMRRAVEAVRRRFGRIDGVFHAAGVLEPALIPFLSPTGAARAMAAKTHGALVLDEVLADDPPSLLVLFSSISGLVGIAGQAAYAAASAFLTAWAHTPPPAGQRRIAIDYGPWRALGMTSGERRQRDRTAPAPGGDEAAHPLLGRPAQPTAHVAAYDAVYRVEELWVLSEHVVRDGLAVLPGAASFETVSAALAGPTPAERPPCTIEDLAFVEPLAVARGGGVSVRVSLVQGPDALRYTLESQAPGLGWHAHVTANVRLGAPAPPAVDLAAIRARCAAERGLDSTAPLRHQARALDFGPRWQARVNVRYGEDEVLATIDAPAAAARDTAFAWHPALMDVAMTSGLALTTPGQSVVTLLWVPAGCDRVVLWRAPGSHLLAHVRFRRAESPERLAVFDVSLLDSSGSVLAQIWGLRLHGVEGDKLSAPRSHTTAPADPVLALAREHGIGEADGAAALELALARLAPEVIVSSLDVNALRAHLASRAAGPAGRPAATRVQRSDGVRATFTEPRTPMEGRLAEVWARQLGLDRVGVHDNFFELGGESLVGLRLFAEIRRTFGVALPVDTLFAAPTVAALAEKLSPRAEPVAGPAVSGAAPAPSTVVVIQPGGDRPRVFCVHDQNGYVLLYRDLAKHLGADQPFVALQAAGLDDLRQIDRSIETMARRYVEAMRQVQPEGPYWLMGSSLGGIVAFEMAQQLTSAGQEVAWLALLDSWTPADLRRWWYGDHEPVGARMRRHVREFIAHGPRRYVNTRRENRRAWRDYLRRAEAERARHAAVAEEVQAHLASGTPMPPEALAVHLEQVYGEAYRAYDARPYARKVTLLRALERGHHRDTDPTLGWELVPLGGLEVIQVPGPHGLMVREPYVSVLALQLRRSIDRELARASGGVRMSVR